MNNNSLQQEAEKRDIERQLTAEARLEKARKLRDYRRNVAKLNAMVIRTEENPPTDSDIQKLELCMWYFRK